jgi:transcriptional regulator with XRE-family HTH domain
MEFGNKLRNLRKERGMTLRILAEQVGVSFTYLSKIENGRVPYTPAPETIRSLANALDVNVLDLLESARKLPPELKLFSKSSEARRFFQRAGEIASPKDWKEMLEILEKRQSEREHKGNNKEGLSKR